MKTEKLLLIVCCILLISTLGLVPAITGAKEVIQTKACHTYKKGSIWPEHVQIFGDMVERETDGRIRFTYYWGGTLYPTYQGQMNAVLSGAIQWNHINTSLFTKYDPRWNVIFAPGLIWGWDHWKVFEQTDAYKNLVKDFEAKSGMKMLYWGCIIPGGDLLFTRKRRVVTPDDWKGLKIRVSPAEAAGMLVKAFGASPIVLSSPEVGAALSQGVVDGGIITMSTAVPAWSSQKTAPYVTILHGGANLGGMMVGMVANLKFWNSLSPDLQEAIKRGILSAQWETLAWTDREARKLSEKYKKTPGTNITYLTKEQTKAWTDVIDREVVTKLKEKYGAELIDAAIATRPK